MSPNGLGAAVISVKWLQPAGTDVTGSAIGMGGIFMSKSGPITTTRTLLTRRSCCFCSTPPAGPATQRTPAASPPLPGLHQIGTAHHPTGQPPRLLTLRGRPETLGSDLLRDTHSRRLQQSRAKKYGAWLTVSTNSEGWEELPYRWEKLWGPDYRNRYDLLLFEGESQQLFFSELPEKSTPPIFDKRDELEAYDVDKGYESISMTVIHLSTP